MLLGFFLNKILNLVTLFEKGAKISQICTSLLKPKKRCLQHFCVKKRSCKRSCMDKSPNVAKKFSKFDNLLKETK
jgi:hypothetical protein